MTNKPMLSVERELLERAVSAVIIARGPGSPTERDLCALLDNPSECRCKRYGKDNPHWPCPVHSEPAAQHQGVSNVSLCANAYSDMQRASKRLGQCISCGEPPEDDGVITHDPSCTLCAMEMASYAEYPAPVATIAILMEAVHAIPGFPGVTGTQLRQLAEYLNGVNP